MYAIKVSHFYVHVYYVCLKVINSWLNLPHGGHGQVICMIVIYQDAGCGGLITCWAWPCTQDEYRLIN